MTCSFSPGSLGAVRGVGKAHRDLGSGQGGMFKGEVAGQEVPGGIWTQGPAAGSPRPLLCQEGWVTGVVRMSRVVCSP